MSEETKEVGQPSPETSSPPIQPDGLGKADVPQGGLKKKPGRSKRGRRPNCEYFLQQFPHFIKIIYPSTNSPDKMGIFVFKKDETTLGIARFTQNDKGDVYWSPRVIADKRGGPPHYVYDLIEIAAVNIEELSNAIGQMTKFFGGTKEIAATYRENVAKTDEKRTMSAMDLKLKDWGVV